MTAPIGNDPNSRIHNDSGTIDPELLLDEINTLLRHENLSREMSSALSTFSSYLGNLDTKYEELLAKDPSTLTPEEQQWMEDVEALLDNIDTLMTSYDNELNNGAINNGAHDALIRDIEALKTLAQNGPAQANTGGTEANAAAETSALGQAYITELQNYETTLGQLEETTTRIEELLELYETVGLTRGQLSELDTLLERKATLQTEATEHAASLDKHQGDVSVPGLSDPDDLDAQLAALNERGSAIDTIVADNRAILDIFNLIIHFSHKGGALEGLGGSILETRQPPIPQEDIDAAYNKKVEEYGELHREMERMMGLMMTRELTPDEQAYVNTLLERGSTIRNELEALKGGTQLTYGTNALRELYQSDFAQHARELNELIPEYETLKTELDTLLAKVENGTASQEDFETLATLSTKMDGLLKDINRLQNAIQTIEEGFKTETPGGERMHTSHVQSLIDNYIGGGKMESLNVAEAREAAYIEGGTYLYTSGYMELATENNRLIEDQATLQTEIDELANKLVTGEITDEELATLNSKLEDMDALLNRMETVQNSITGIVNNADDPQQMAAIDAEFRSAGLLKPYDVDAAREIMNAQMGLVAMANDAQELMGLQTTISELTARVESGEPPLTEEEWAQLEQAIADYNTLSSSIDANLQAYLVLLNSQMPTADENGNFTGEQYASMMDIMYKASQVENMMSGFQAQNDGFLDDTSDAITNMVNLSSQPGVAPDRAADFTRAISLLSYSETNQTGINTHVNAKENRPLDLQEYQALQDEIMSHIDGYDEEVPLYDLIWNTFTETIERSEQQTALILETMEQEQEQLRAVTSELNDVNALLNGDFSDNQLRARIEENNLTPEDINALLGKEHSFEHTPESDPEAYLNEVKGLLQAEQDNLKTSESENLLLLQQAQKEEAAAVSALANFLDIWHKMMEDIIRHMGS